MEVHNTREEVLINNGNNRCILEFDQDRLYLFWNVRSNVICLYYPHSCVIKVSEVCGFAKECGNI